MRSAWRLTPSSAILLRYLSLVPEFDVFFPSLLVWVIRSLNSSGLWRWRFVKLFLFCAVNVFFFPLSFVFVYLIFRSRNGGSVADEEDCQEACQEVQEAPERPQDLREGETNLFLVFLLKCAHTFCVKCIYYYFKSIGSLSFMHSSWVIIVGCWCEILVIYQILVRPVLLNQNVSSVNCPNK